MKIAVQAKLLDCFILLKSKQKHIEQELSKKNHFYFQNYLDESNRTNLIKLILSDTFFICQKY